MKPSYIALREAVVSRLSADADLVALLGGARIFDEVPRGLDGLYCVIGPWKARDWSTGTDAGEEHDITLTVWARGGSARSALESAGRIDALLGEASLPLDGHRLVAIRTVETEARRDERADRARVTLRLRAVMERLPAP